MLLFTDAYISITLPAWLECVSLCACSLYISQGCRQTPLLLRWPQQKNQATLLLQTQTRPIVTCPTTPRTQCLVAPILRTQCPTLTPPILSWVRIVHLQWVAILQTRMEVVAKVHTQMTPRWAMVTPRPVLLWQLPPTWSGTMVQCSSPRCRPGSPNSWPMVRTVEDALRSRGCVNLHDSKVRGADIGPTWVRQDTGGSNVGPMNLAIWAPT